MAGVHPVLRALDAGETFFHQSDQVSCMNFAVLAERDGPLAPEQIQRGLDALQQDHLLLQAAIVESDAPHLGFALRPEARIALQCRQIEAEHWRDAVTELLQTGFDTGTAPLMRGLYLEFPDRRCVLALCFHHSIADGRSGMALLQSLLAHIAGAAPVSAPQRLHPPMAELMPPAWRWDEQAQAAAALKAAVVADYRRHGAPTALPWLDRAGPHSAPQLARLQFEPALTLRLMARARAENTSLHGALCAAQLLAVRQLQPELATQVLTLASPVDMRAHLTPPPEPTPIGLHVAIVSSSHRIEADTPLWALAREIRAHLQTQIGRGEAHLFYELYGLDRVAPTLEQAQTLKKKLPASPPHTMVSNVGAIAPASADPLLRNLSFALFPMPYQSLFTAASSYQDRLTLNIGFNAARLGDHAPVLIEALRQNLLRAAD